MDEISNEKVYITEPHIIGGMFGLEYITNLNNCAPSFLRSRNILLANARSGISLLIELLLPHRVWLPSYLCSVILKAIDENMTSVKFYEVNYNLAVPSLEWLDNVQKGDLVVLIDYFGFSCDSFCAIQAKERGAWVLEDACQALLSAEVGQSSDFVLFSPRKFLGIPEGGILVVNYEIDLQGVNLKSPPADWWLKAFYATVLRREFDLYGGSRRWFQLFRETNAEGPIGHYAMSEFSKILLMHGFDYSTIAKRRVDNYRTLSDKLSNLALFPKLSSGVVPLGFPIRVRNRDQVRQMLFDHEMYPPLHWPIQDVVPEKFKESHQLASEIMTLPCDQRYNSSDMNRMAQLVCEVLE